MKKYDLLKKTIEIPYKKKGTIRQGCSADHPCVDSDLILSFNAEKKDRALQNLKNYETTVDYVRGHVSSFFEVTEYYVEENEYDEDGEWISGGDIWGFSEMPICLGNVFCNKRTWDAIASYMDDEKREQVHAELAPCTEDEFLSRYLELDPDFEDLLWNEFSIRI